MLAARRMMVDRARHVVAPTIFEQQDLYDYTTTTVTAQTSSFASAVHAGSIVLLNITYVAVWGDPTGISGLGATWVLLEKAPSTSPLLHRQCAVYIGTGCTGGSGITVTMPTSGNPSGNQWALEAVEFSGASGVTGFTMRDWAGNWPDGTLPYAPPVQTAAGGGQVFVAGTFWEWGSSPGPPTMSSGSDVDGAWSTSSFAGYPSAPPELGMALPIHWHTSAGSGSQRAFRNVGADAGSGTACTWSARLT